MEHGDERVRAFFSATADVVYRMSPDWRVLRYLTGRQFLTDSAEPNDRWLERYVPRDDQEALMASVGAAIAAKGAFELEHRVMRLDGSIGWVWSRAIPLLDDQGAIVEWVGTARDVTARRTADEQLFRVTEEAEHRRRLYEAVLSTTPDLVYVFGLDHRFTYANEALLAMWGRTWDEAIGRTCLELGYEPWHAAMHDREIEQVIATRQPIRGDVPFSGTNGRRMYDYIFVPVFGPGGEVEAVAGTTRDVTARTLAEDTLRESERRLADANRMKDEFLATLSHELRTPLNAVLGWSRMLRTGEMRDDLRERALEAIERNARAQAQLVDDLLDVSRIMSGKLLMKHEPVELTAVIGAALDAVRPAAGTRSIQLRVVTESNDAILVDGDAERLQQVFWNLLANAVKFTAPGGDVAVHLVTDGAWVDVAVVDTGEGIASEFLPHVFDRFRQADSTPSRRHGGLGLGLAIVRHLTEAQGGSVSAFSDGEGLGARFVVRLPVRLLAERPRPSVAAGVDAASQLLAHRRILVVDDSADMRELIQIMLEGHGAQVVAAASAGDALYALGEREFDVLVADIAMPGQDGYDLIRAIRSLPDERGGRIPAIAVTAYPSARDRNDALTAGYNWHLRKPVDPDALVAALARAVA